MNATRRLPRLRLLVAASMLAVSTGACTGGGGDGTAAEEPAHVVEVAGSDIPEVHVTRAAHDRLRMTTTAVADDGTMLVVPSGAVVFDPDGTRWVYTSPEALTYVRHEVQVDHERDGHAYLTDGPAVGTQVVALGAAELYGVEHGIGH